MTKAACERIDWLIANAKDGWAGLDSKAPSKKLLAIALDLSNYADAHNLHVPGIFPSGDGDVILEWNFDQESPSLYYNPSVELNTDGSYYCHDYAGKDADSVMKEVDTHSLVRVQQFMREAASKDRGL